MSTIYVTDNQILYLCIYHIYNAKKNRGLIRYTLSHYLKRTSQSEPNATSALHVTETEIDKTTFELYQNRVS